MRGILVCDIIVGRKMILQIRLKKIDLGFVMPFCKLKIIEL